MKIRVCIYITVEALCLSLTACKKDKTIPIAQLTITGFNPTHGFTGDTVIISGTEFTADDNVYFNNPVDFIPGAQDPDLWKMGIVLGTAEWDSCREQNELMSSLLLAKNIGHWLDIRAQRSHDWPVWREMFPHYISMLPLPS